MSHRRMWPPNVEHTYFYASTLYGGEVQATFIISDYEENADLRRMWEQIDCMSRAELVVHDGKLPFSYICAPPREFR